MDLETSISELTGAMLSQEAEALQNAIQAVGGGEQMSLSLLDAADTFAVPNSTLCNTDGQSVDEITSTNVEVKVVPSRSSYRKDMMQKAVEAVREGRMSKNLAARTFGVPRSTLFDRVFNRHSQDLGRSTALSAHEEEKLASWAIEMAQIGYTRTRIDANNSVKDMLDSENRKTVFKDNKPGCDWWKAFQKRHPKISEYLPKQTGSEKTVITSNSVKQWYERYERYILEDVKDLSLLHEPSRIYHADQVYSMQFSLCPKSGEVRAKKGSKSVLSVITRKSQITVFACIGATGDYHRPFIVYPRHALEHSPSEGFPEATIGATDKGWMDAEMFCKWLEDVFIPEINDKAVKKPVVLFVDGHSIRILMRTTDMCKEHGIVLYCLLDHASLQMQPCDLAVSGHLKVAWKEAVEHFQASSENIGEHVTERTFAKVFKEAWIQATSLANAVNGFSEAGIYPLDPNKVLDTANFVPSVVVKTTGQIAE